LSQAPPVLQLIPGDAPFDEAQRAWLNGFFNALLTQPRAPQAGGEAQAVSGKTITVLYGSQTGTAESWSKKFAKRLKTQGMAARAVELSSISLSDLAEEQLALVIASTYGEGEPPDSCAAFASQLASQDAPDLSALSFSVLALGDRNYPKFCAFGHAIDEALERLGATRLAPVCEVDSAAAATFASWQDAMVAALKPLAGSNASATSDANALDGSDQGADDHEASDIAGMSRDHPFGATLLSNRRLNHVDSDKETRHVVLSLAGASWRYLPGDALGVWPRNPLALVTRLIDGLGLRQDAVVIVERRPLSLVETLSSHCEISRMTTAVVLRFARHFHDSALENLCQGDDSAALTALLHGLDALTLARRVTGASFTPQLLVDLLPPLAPRLYSISSSSAAHPDEVHLTVALARYEIEQETRDGLSSAFLAHQDRLLATVPVYLHKNNRFRLPSDPTVPIIMIGPGTGIAPFRSFLEERRAANLSGRSWLFFGDRKASLDFLYQDELEAYLADGTLSRLDTAFSRDGSDKVYVQQRMLEQGEQLWSWLAEGAFIYVCGDAQRMAKDVDAALQEILVKHGRMSEAKALLELRHWGAIGRYLRDVY
jgi:sulfite reductase (NADPH) flavoprotein alpha-component